MMNNKKFHEIHSSLQTKYHPKFGHENLHSEERSESPNESDNDDRYHARTVLTHHLFHANIKKTQTRWIRETPV